MPSANSMYMSLDRALYLNGREIVTVVDKAGREMTIAAKPQDLEGVCRIVKWETSSKAARTHPVGPNALLPPTRSFAKCCLCNHKITSGQHVIACENGHTRHPGCIHALNFACPVCNSANVDTMMGNTYLDCIERNDEYHGESTPTDQPCRQGGTYAGQWCSDERHGRGTRKYESGSVYVGQYENDKRHGEGTKVYANEGGKFEGHWKRGKRHGTGKRTYASGRVIEGEWRNGKRIRVFNQYPSAVRDAKKARMSS